MTAKKIWFYSACTIVLGLILAAVGFFSGANPNVYFGKNGVQIADTTSQIISPENLDAFESIDLNVNQSNIEFISSDHYGVIITYYGENNQYTCTEEKGALVIADKAAQSNNFRINFSFMPPATQNTVKIYLPQNAKLKNLKVKDQLGSFTAGNFTSTNTDIQLPYGKLDLTDSDCGATSVTLQNGESRIKNVKTESLIFKNNFGSSNFENITVSSPEKAKIDMQNGSVSVKNFTADSLEINDAYGGATLDALNLSQFKSNMGNGSLKMGNSYIQNSEIENNLGEINIVGLQSGGTNIKANNGRINLDGTLNGKNVIHSNLGSVSVKTSLEQGQYTYNLSSNLGGLTINGNNVGSPAVFQSQNVQNNLSISSNNGHTSIDFQD